jgi:hypothetical protein
MIPRIGDKRQRFGKTWVILGLGAISRDAILLIQCVQTGEREYWLWSEFSKWSAA